jgi:hypothetical protein
MLISEISAIQNYFWTNYGNCGCFTEVKNVGPATFLFAEHSGEHEQLGFFIEIRLIIETFTEFFK